MNPTHPTLPLVVRFVRRACWVKGLITSLVGFLVETDDSDDLDDVDPLANGVTVTTKGAPTFTDVDGTREKDIGEDPFVMKL